MIETGLPQSPEQPVESVLREELARGDIVLGTITPILGHLLANHTNTLFSDAIVARVRGMLSHIAQQLLTAPFDDHAAGRVFADSMRGQMTEHLVYSQPLLAHCHALALESLAIDRLHTRCAIDPVLPPLLQSLIASEEAEIAATAMAALASQARFQQAQHHMELPLGELPGDLFNDVLGIYPELETGDDVPDFTAADAALREAYDEGASRIGLLERLIAGMGGGARAALWVSHAGLPLFFTALGSLSNQPRDLAVISSDEGQLARFALALRSGGLKPDEVAEQFVHFHPEISLAEGFETLRTDRAKTMLAAGLGWAGI